MKFDLMHIWASMGLMSRLVAFALVLMAIASIAVAVERALALSRQGRETATFSREIAPLLDAWEIGLIIAAAEKYPHSALARLVAAAFRRYRRATEDASGNVGAAELARREMDRKREAISADLRRGMSVLASVG